MSRCLIKKIAVMSPAILALTIFVYKTPFLSAGSYTDSAHGNSTYGVKTTTRGTGDYARGNCAHCHEQHASIGGSEPQPKNGQATPYALFTNNFTDQTEDFCFECHKGTGSRQDDFQRTNYNYSYWFGGDTTNNLQPNTIYDAFNPPVTPNPTSDYLMYASAHNLDDILTFIKTKWPETFKDESNPCSACHNPHLAKRGFPIVRPTDRNNIWGDEADETMSAFASAHGGTYQAPYRYNTTAAFEPDGSSTQDGSNLPDYPTFCSDCHNATNDIWSTPLGRNLKKIDWAATAKTTFPGDYHGSVTRCQDVDGSLKGWGSLKEPYYSRNAANFITSCTDCHEPHGSIFKYLLRQSVNGILVYKRPQGPGPAVPDLNNEFCRACHVHNAHCNNEWNCIPCHYHSASAGCWGPPPCSVGGVGHTF